MSMIGNALQNITQRQISVKDKGCKRKKRKHDHPQPIETPSPLKPALRPLKLAYEASKAELCKAMEIKPKSKVSLPAPLVKHNLASGDYTTKINERFKNIDLTEEFGVSEINTVATNISKILIEAILQFEDQWFFVTEYEMYVRNRSQVDDCAQESWWLMYPGEVEAYIVKKNEKGNTWFEVSIFWDRLEFLITGGVRGNYSDGTLAPFLGSAQKHLEPMNLQTHTRTSNIIIREEGAEVSQTTRRLRQYKKQAAHLKWLFRSSKFVRKGFHTTVSLDVHLNLAKANMASVASFLLSKVVEKKFEESDVKHTLKLMADTSAFPLNKRSMTLRTFKKDYRQMNLPPSYQSIFKCFIYLSEGKIEELTSDDILSVYKGTLANYCKNEDEKKLRRNTHLL
ncbi:hypothetical protein INT47_000202 [Mucor saturninus]|uniref:Uncharacterized protein n=1 Tax=Mucor saturninus TaxID=64648 RepID=A0A8H7R2J3_9FUNG|nr:hypothetical protein INT47_000202 [Mucor saturninus]